MLYMKNPLKDKISLLKSYFLFYFKYILLSTDEILKKDFKRIWCLEISE